MLAAHVQSAIPARLSIPCARHGSPWPAPSRVQSDGIRMRHKLTDVQLPTRSICACPEWWKQLRPSGRLRPWTCEQPVLHPHAWRSPSAGAGVVVAFAANQLPSPHIAVSIAGEPTRPTLAAEARQTLKPTFDASHSQARSLPSKAAQAGTQINACCSVKFSRGDGAVQMASAQHHLGSSVVHIPRRRIILVIL